MKPEEQASESWKPYATDRPSLAGVYEWRVPSIAVPGMTVRFAAHMRTRGAGWGSVLSPAFDYWDGYKIIVPEGTEWRPMTNPPTIRDHDYHDVRPEFVAFRPCPFCQKVPTLRGLATSGDGVYVGGKPHEFNRWWTECCEWARSPRFSDPRELCKTHNSLITSTLSAQESEKPKADDGVGLIAAERARQVAKEGWTAEHDDDHDLEQMARAAACYAQPDRIRGTKMLGYYQPSRSPKVRMIVPVDWPWAWEWWKPEPDNRIRELVKAGALIAAEIDRLQRASALQSQSLQGPEPTTERESQ